MQFAEVPPSSENHETGMEAQSVRHRVTGKQPAPVGFPQPTSMEVDRGKRLREISEEEEQKEEKEGRLRESIALMLKDAKAGEFDHILDYNLQVRDEENERRRIHVRGSLALFEKRGPPWLSDRDGEILDPEKVLQGMQKENDSLRDFGVYEEVPESEAKNARVIPTRWVPGGRGRPMARQDSKGA